jgi:hypothetical protein
LSAAACIITALDSTTAVLRRCVFCTLISLGVVTQDGPGLRPCCATETDRQKTSRQGMTDTRDQRCTDSITQEGTPLEAHDRGMARSIHGPEGQVPALAVVVLAAAAHTNNKEAVISPLSLKDTSPFARICSHVLAWAHVCTCSMVCCSRTTTRTRRRHTRTQKDIAELHYNERPDNARSSRVSMIMRRS